MRQPKSPPEVRLVCLIPPEQVRDLLANNKLQQLEELKAFFRSIGQIIPDQLTDQALEQFCVWSELPWSALDPSLVEQYGDYVLEAMQQYQRSLNQDTANKVGQEELESLRKTLEKIQHRSYEEPHSSSVELEVSLQIGLTLIKQLCESPENMCEVRLDLLRSLEEEITAWLKWWRTLQ